MSKRSSKRYRKSRRNLLKKFGTATRRALPVVKKGITRIGSNVAIAAKTSAPTVRSGFKNLYNSLAVGLEKGIGKVKSLKRRH
jgi:hypothetical protein